MSERSWVGKRLPIRARCGFPASGDASAFQRSKERHVDILKVDIGQLEKAVNTLVNRPRLIRREYWVSQIGTLLERPSITAPDRQRLFALLDLLGTVAPVSPQ
jgi:hypothetical protein